MVFGRARSLSISTVFLRESSLSGLISLLGTPLSVLLRFKEMRLTGSSFPGIRQCQHFVRSLYFFGQVVPYERQRSCQHVKVKSLGDFFMLCEVLLQLLGTTDMDVGASLPHFRKMRSTISASNQSSSLRFENGFIQLSWRMLSDNLC